MLETSKSRRGLLPTLFASNLLAPVIGLAWTTGVLVAFGAVLGDALSGFAKRRMRLPPSGRVPGIDQNFGSNRTEQAAPLG